MIYHENVNVNLMEQNIIQIIGGILINLDVSVKSIIYMKNIIQGILVDVFVKMEKYLVNIMDDSMIT